MKKITKQKALILLIMGLTLIATTQIASQFMVLHDIAKGFCTGIGIGLLLTSLLLGNFKIATR